MRDFKIGDKVYYRGNDVTIPTKKQLTVMATRNDFVHNAIQIKEFAEKDFWIPDVFKLANPASLENK